MRERGSGREREGGNEGREERGERRRQRGRQTPKEREHVIRKDKDLNTSPMRT